RGVGSFSRREPLTCLLENGDSRVGTDRRAGLENHMSKKRQAGIERMGPGTYRIRARLTCPRTGKRKEADRVVQCSDLTDARLLQAKLREELLRESDEPRKRLTVDDYATSWLERRKPSLKPSTGIRYGEQLDLAMEWIGEIYMDALLPHDVNMCLVELA